MGRWWRRRSLRARLTMVAAGSLAAGLAGGSLIIVKGFEASRLHAIDSSARQVATNIANLAAAGALPPTLPVQAGETAQVLNAAGQVEAVSPGTLRTLPLVPLATAVALADHGPRDLRLGDLDQDDRSRVLIRRVTVAGEPQYVVLAVSLRAERDTLRGLALVMLIAAPLLVLVVAVGVWLLLGRAFGHVTRMRLAAQAVTDPAAGSRLPVPANHDEIYALAGTLNAMLDRLAAAHARERVFVADVAHELRSPLASIRTQLEVALTHPDPATATELTTGSLADVVRLGELVDDLLALARLDAGAFSPADVDLGALAGLAADPAHTVRGDHAALRRAVDNLLANAQRHKETTVTVDVHRVGTDVRLQVSDDGPGIPDADRDRVFERFVRLDDARTRATGGAGLGLAIVAATAAAHHGSVHVEAADSGGARFVLTLPAAEPGY